MGDIIADGNTTLTAGVAQLMEATQTFTHAVENV